MRVKKLNWALSICILGFLLFASGMLFPQEGVGRGRIKGTVKDTAGRPLQGVKIVASFQDEVDFEAITDEKGHWAIAGLGTGLFRITATKEGYQTVVVEQNISQFKNKPIDFTLSSLTAHPDRASSSEGVASLEAFEQGIKLYDEEQYAEALAKFKEFLSSNPTESKVRVNIANCYRQMDRYGEAIEEYQAALDGIVEEKGALAGDGLAAEILAALGEIHVRQGDLEKASEYFQKSIDVNPQDERLAFNVAEICFNQNQTEKAIAYYKLAVDINPEWPRPYPRMGYAYLNTGNYPAALECFRKFLELAPDDPQAPAIRKLIPSIEKLIKNPGNPLS